MRRRDFIATLGAAAAWPLASHAQQGGGPLKIGILMAYASGDAEAKARVDAFIAEFARLGWVDGRNIRFDYRWSGGDPARIAADAASLVAAQPALILAATTPVVRALLKETRTIPIVFLSVSDPVGDGFVKSMAQPGGNATGFINIEASMAGKWVELAKELAPGIARVCIIFNPKTAAGAGNYFMPPFRSAAKSMRLEAVALPVQDPAEFDKAVASIGGASALIVMPDSYNVVHRRRIIELSARHRVPAVYPYRYMAIDGGLMSYGVDLADMYRRAASHADRILRGRPASDLPIQAPVKFELVINNRTARALGIDVPPRLLARADEIIE
jgi:putative ABC transport system substrate-binding protein